MRHRRSARGSARGLAAMGSTPARGASERALVFETLPRSHVRRRNDMPRARELKIRVENRPGMLGEVASALAEQKINLRAVNAWVERGQGVIRLVADKLPAARKVLSKRGW